MFSHTSIFFNPEEFNPPPAAEHPGSSECCGEWHRDAQYIHPNEEDEKGLVLHPEEVMGGQMMCGAALSSTSRSESALATSLNSYCSR